MNEETISAATSYLLNTYIGEYKQRKMEIKYVTLNTQDIYDQLVKLYTNFFDSNLRWFLNSLKFILPSFGSPESYMAKVYVSHWLVDLYVSNQEAVTNLGLIEIPDFYLYHEDHHSHVYDCYLAELNSQTRPTQLKHTLEELLYIPVISIEPDFSNKKNPFCIKEFKLDRFLFQGIISTLEKQRICKMKSLLDDYLRGKPSWLLDWHTCGAFAWFCKEGNYCLDDITIAYILGVACTENLGISDADDWQKSPAHSVNVLELVCQPEKYTRITEQKLYGTCEVRAIEFEKNCIRDKAARFRLVDWFYHCHVIFEVDNQSRLFAHMMMISLKNISVSSSM